MGKIWVTQFTGGLDSRRLPETTTGGVLLRANDGHITRGGEFEKRAAFVKAYTLPPATIGLAQTVAGLVVFGSAAPPAGLPPGVTYQQLQKADGVTPIARILSYDLYAGKIYVVAEFTDGTRVHFYDGVRVDAWFDGRARAKITVVSGQNSGAVAASGRFRVTGGTAGAGNTVDAIKIDGVSVTNGTSIPYTSNAGTASAIASAVNSFVSTPDYTATASSNEVVLTATTPGAGPNGFAIAGAVSGNVSYQGDASLSGGKDGKVSSLPSLSVAGVQLLGAAVYWYDTPTRMAHDIVAAVNANGAVSGFSAAQDGESFNITAGTAAAADNGKSVDFTLLDGLVFNPTGGLVLSGGVDVGSSYTPGTFVKTIGTKVYSVSGPNCHFSGVKDPTHWTTDVVGAGFIDMSAQSSGSEQLYALAKYNKYVAVFAGKTTQIWFMDPDPTQNQQVQVLGNTGTFSPRSVTQFGDSDLFYLDESGLRSLRARDASNAAATTDVGVPIDTIIIAKLQTLTLDDRQNIFGVIEPVEGRFWLCIQDTIYVFSFFQGPGISAWTTYSPGFTIDAAVVHAQRVYLRSGNDIYVYGGLAAVPVYDGTSAEAWLPFLDANDPSRHKTWTSVDAALTGLWDLSLAMEPTKPEIQEPIATLTETTYNRLDTAMQHRSTHASPRLKSRGIGPAKLAAFVLHYAGDETEA